MTSWKWVTLQFIWVLVAAGPRAGLWWPLWVLSNPEYSVILWSYISHWRTYITPFSINIITFPKFFLLLLLSVFAFRLSSCCTILPLKDRLDNCPPISCKWLNWSHNSLSEVMYLKFKTGIILPLCWRGLSNVCNVGGETTLLYFMFLVLSCPVTHQTYSILDPLTANPEGYWHIAVKCDKH